MKKLILLCLLSFLATSWAKVPIPSVDTSLGDFDFNIPLIEILGKGIENLDFTIYYKKPHPFSFGRVIHYPKSPLGNLWEHNFNIVLHYKPYELNEAARYELSHNTLGGTPPTSLPPSLNFRYPLPNTLHDHISFSGEALWFWRLRSFKQTPSLPRIEIAEKGTKKVYGVEKDLFYEGAEIFSSSYHSKEKVYPTEDGFIKEDPNGTKYYF